MVVPARLLAVWVAASARGATGGISAESRRPGARPSNAGTARRPTGHLALLLGPFGALVWCTPIHRSVKGQKVPCKRGPSAASSVSRQFNSGTSSVDTEEIKRKKRLRRNRRERGGRWAAPRFRALTNTLVFLTTKDLKCDSKSVPSSLETALQSTESS